MLKSFNGAQLVGVGLRHPHYAHVLEHKPPVSWFEVHSENFFMEGGPSLHFLDKIREDYPLSLHGIGLSLGSAEGIDKHHLKKLKTLINRFSPFLFSEHLSWSIVDGIYVPDLLPLPYTDETLKIMTQNIDQAQTELGQELLIENPSTYLEYKDSYIPEPEFLVNLSQKTGAKLLLDINNIYVSSCNHGWDGHAYINEIPPDLVKEIHLAGHEIKTFEDGSKIRIDTHSSHVCDDVWELFQQALDRGVHAPTLIEWDTDIPDFNTLINEAILAQGFIDQRRKKSA